MISFECDYSTGCHPEILRRLAETNLEPLPGYGADRYCESAKQKIKQAFCCDNHEVFFLSGGTQTNTIVIASLLEKYEGVIAADTGHISLHEAGAVEYTGHKVLCLPHCDGKLVPEELDKYVADFYKDENHEHMVFPGMVYVSHPTENGTLYTRSELTAISEICRKYNMRLYLDGARLGYALMSKETDLTAGDIARLCDAFYIGGTKVGAICGEAVVFKKEALPRHFMTIVKQHTALLAKGRLLGVQFDTLFTDNLYFDISRHAIETAEYLKNVLKEKNCRFAWESHTNQQFIILENDFYEKLKSQAGIAFWEKYDENHTVVRLATSWSTQVQDIEKLRLLL